MSGTVAKRRSWWAIPDRVWHVAIAAMWIMAIVGMFVEIRHHRRVNATEKGEGGMSVRAKFRCTGAEEVEGVEGISVLLQAVTDDSPENKSWSKYTPSGTLTMVVTNPAASSQFVYGNSYYLDFTDAPK